MDVAVPQPLWQVVVQMFPTVMVGVVLGQHFAGQERVLTDNISQSGIGPHENGGAGQG